MKITKLLITVFLIIIAFTACTKPVEETRFKKGSVIFIHPDGTGLSNWNAARILYYGPDGELNWDKMSNVGLYKSHFKDCLTATSHAGATVHSYGVKVVQDSYGLDGTEEITARSGKKMNIMQEAQSAGIKTGIINSGSIIEPGTGVFAASSVSRRNYEEITKKICESGIDVILSGGEEWMLPEGTEGRHGFGKRTDGINLIYYMRDQGYYVVYDKKELAEVPANVTKLFGVFALSHTFNDKPEEELKKENLPNYKIEAPTLAEMTESAIDILGRNNQQFFLVIEEEGTDNFANSNNANGMLDALKRADDAIGVVLDYQMKNPLTLLITAADSESGGMELLGKNISKFEKGSKVPKTDPNSAPVDGTEGTETDFFYSAPDQFGNRLPFQISWGTSGDAYGGVVARANGLNASEMNGTIDNTDIYKFMYLTLFGKLLE